MDGYDGELWTLQYSTAQYLILGRRPAPASPHTRCRQLTIGGEASLLTGEVFLRRAARYHRTCTTARSVQREPPQTST